MNLILSLADVLKEFIPKGVSAIEEAIIREQIRHPVSIGTMYEGLTKEALNLALFEKLDLRVHTNGHIRGSKTEFDVLLVEGEGERMPFSDRFIFNPNQVIAIIQVEKNLFSTDLESGYNNLKFLIDLFEPEKMEDYMKEILRDSFRGICRKDIHSFLNNELTLQEEMVYHTLRVESFLPVRIIWGFNGFASELSFREAFVKYLETNITTTFEGRIEGFGPHNFPNLIICDKYCMIKSNGMPYCGPLQQNMSWPFYMTSSDNIARTLLELLWSRLSYRYDLTSDIFGEDLEVEQAKLYLNATVTKLGEHGGWHYDYVPLDNTELVKPHISTEWEPAILDNFQFVIVQHLCASYEIDTIGDLEFRDAVLKNGYVSVENFVSQLNKTGLTYLTEGKLRLLTDECQCVILPDGRYIAGENKSDRLSHWIRKNIK